MSEPRTEGERHKEAMRLWTEAAELLKQAPEQCPWCFGSHGCALDLGHDNGCVCSCGMRAQGVLDAGGLLFDALSNEKWDGIPNEDGEAKVPARLAAAYDANPA